jgi:hypothetical protein
VSKVDDVADILYDFLKVKHRNEAFRLREILVATRLRNNATTATAMRRIREYAIADDLCVRLPCPANGQTYAVTDDPNMVYDSAIHLWLVADGVKRTEYQQRSFIRRNDTLLPRGDREIVKIIDEFEESQRGQQQLLHRLIAVTVETRRKGRNSE